MNAVDDELAVAELAQRQAQERIELLRAMKAKAPVPAVPKRLRAVNSPQTHAIEAKLQSQPGRRFRTIELLVLLWTGFDASQLQERGSLAQLQRKQLLQRLQTTIAIHLAVEGWQLYMTRKVRDPQLERIDKRAGSSRQWYAKPCAKPVRRPILEVMTK